MSFLIFIGFWIVLGLVGALARILTKGSFDWGNDIGNGAMILFMILGAPLMIVVIPIQIVAWAFNKLFGKSPATNK